MIKYIDVTTDGCLRLDDLESCLDYPLCGFHDDEEVLIAGWVLPPEPLDNNIRVIIRVVENQRVRDIATTIIKRADVFKVKRPSESYSEDAMNIGFSAKLSFTHNCSATIIIVKNEQETPWCQVNIFISECLTSYVQKINSGSQFKNVAINIEEIERHIKIYSLGTFNLDRMSVVHSDLKKIKKSVDDGNFIISLFNSVNGEVQCLRHELNFKIYRSIYSGESNFLFCHDRNGVLFVIHQHVTSCDGIYFPTKGLFYSHCHSSEKYIKNIIELLLNGNDCSLVHQKQIKEIAFLTGHGRPYHFMYDSMLGLEIVYSEESVTKNNKRFYMLNHHSFIDAPKIFNRNQSAILVDEKDISYLESTGVLFIKLGALFGGGANEPAKLDKIRAFDEKVIAYSNELNTLNGEFAIDLKKHFPIVWFGVTGQKRSWLEQVEGYANIINRLYNVFPGMAVVFDGWTSPIKKTKLDEVESLNDRSIVDGIKRQIAQDIKTIDLIGSTIEYKVYIGTAIDFAVVNRGTGSMNISRICGRPCVTHISNSFYPAAKQQHIHQYAHHLKQELIIDVIKKDCGIDSVSYHANWMDIYNEIIKLVGCINVLENREK